MSKSPRPAPYHLMSTAEKAVYARVIALPETRCEACDVGLLERELDAHAERCRGSVEARNAEIWRRRVALDLRRRRRGWLGRRDV